QLIPVKVKFSFNRIAKNKQIWVTAKSRKKMIQRGTILTFFKMFCMIFVLVKIRLRQPQSQQLMNGIAETLDAY
ncbi:MAG: hypothetical protein B7X75_06205, partial [Sphingobacteriales bacterium 39-40-5]